MATAGLRVLAVLFAASWFVFPGFGLIDLSVTWDPYWPVMLEAGWGLLFTVLVGVAFVAIALFPRRAAPAIVQLLVVAAALTLSAVVGLEAPALWLAAAVAVETLIFLAVPGRESVRPRPLVVWWPLAVVAALGVVPWSVHAWRMYEANHAGLVGDDTMGVEHYPVQGAAALAVAALACLASAWPRGRRFIGVGVGVVAAYLGLVSYAWPGAIGGYGRVWSLAAMAWGVAVAVLALAAPRRTGPQTKNARSEDRALGWS